jgi:hypothetical protein
MNMRLSGVNTQNIVPGNELTCLARAGAVVILYGCQVTSATVIGSDDDGMMMMDFHDFMLSASTSHFLEDKSIDKFNNPAEPSLSGAPGRCGLIIGAFFNSSSSH